MNQNRSLTTWRKTSAILAFIATTLCGHYAVAEEGMGGQLPSASASVQPQKASVDTSGTADWQGVTIDGLAGTRMQETLARPADDQQAINTRGAKEVELYKKASPSVVLVVTNEGIGSGSYLGSNLILTNWHVVKDMQEVGVIFKPAAEGGKVDPAEILRAAVIKLDPVRDMALLKIPATPSSVRPIELATEGDIAIGADVHAIGHPAGEVWTYTRGFISQVRRDFEWKTQDSTHRATVIQTQTPINPGNSGGPLLDDNARLLGMNSFKAPGEALNFAVSVEEIAAFLQSPVPSQKVFRDRLCEPTTLYEGRNDTLDGDLIQVDSNCDGKADVAIVALDDKGQPIKAFIDSNFDDKVDIVVDDTDRDGKWDLSIHDVNFDGSTDLVGHHPDGQIAPSKYENYAAAR